MDLNQLIENKTELEQLRIANRVELWARDVRRALRRRKELLEWSRQLSPAARSEVSARLDADLAAINGETEPKDAETSGE